jgi:DNA-directed RNA polymerase specialized sigma subunit
VDAAATSGSERDRLLEQVVATNDAVVRAVVDRWVADDAPQLAVTLERIAREALAVAAGSFDVEAGEEFLPYAVRLIRLEIKRYLR